MSTYDDLSQEWPNDEQLRMLHDLQVGKRFVVNGERHIFELAEIRYPIEMQPILVCWEMEGPSRNPTKRMRRAFPLSKLLRVVPPDA